MTKEVVKGPSLKEIAESCLSIISM